MLVCGAIALSASCVGPTPTSRPECVPAVVTPVVVAFSPENIAYMDAFRRMHQELAKCDLVRQSPIASTSWPATPCYEPIPDEYLRVWVELVELVDQSERPMPRFPSPAEVHASELDVLAVEITRSTDQHALLVASHDADQAAFSRVLTWLEACGGTVVE